MQLPRIDKDDPMFITVKLLVDQITELEQEVKELKIKEQTSVPHKSEGKDKNFIVVIDGSSVSLYIKTSRGFKSVALS